VTLRAAPPGPTITDIADLKRATVGVFAGDTNQNIMGVLTRSYDHGCALAVSQVG